MNESQFFKLVSDYGSTRFDDGALEANDPCRPTIVKMTQAAARAIVDEWRQLRNENKNLLRKLQIANEATQFCHDHHWPVSVGRQISDIQCPWNYRWASGAEKCCMLKRGHLAPHIDDEGNWGDDMVLDHEREALANPVLRKEP